MSNAVVYDTRARRSYSYRCQSLKRVAGDSCVDARVFQRFSNCHREAKTRAYEPVEALRTRGRLVLILVPRTRRPRYRFVAVTAKNRLLPSSYQRGINADALAPETLIHTRAQYNDACYAADASADRQGLGGEPRHHPARRLDWRRRRSLLLPRRGAGGRRRELRRGRRRRAHLRR